MAPDSPSAAAPSTPAQASPLSVELSADASTGYAAIQNHVPVVRELIVRNRGVLPLSNVTVTVVCTPPFAAGTTLQFAQLAPGEERRSGPLDLGPDHARLAAQDETEQASISAVASCAGVPDARAQRAIDLLAYDQWAGTRALPELLAAFCMPNARVVDGLIAAASKLLRESGLEGTMNGYQAKHREPVWQQVSALYGTIAAAGLHYANPPASFGADGQKIRTPERILEAKLATCLDLAMLFASCLEQAGLHPVVLLKEGHAWAGVWLVDTCFATALVDDVQAVRKRVAAGELLVFETTGVTAAAAASLRHACAQGEALLEDEEGFSYAIDIRRARALQILPLPSRSGVLEATPAPPGAAGPAIEVMPPLPPLDGAALPVSDGGPADTPEGRLASWKSKLLDLTLRNRLLNFKPSKTSLRVICPDAGAFEDALAEGREFRLRAAPAVMTGPATPDARDAEVFAARHGASPIDLLASDALGRHEILVDCADDALDTRLLDIFRTAGTGLEEGGANTLFLAFGMLEWQEDKHAETRHLAPILLIPVTLTRQSVRSGFRLTRHDDDALVNPTLVQKLWHDFQLRLPSFEVLPTDDKGLDVARILQTFRLHVAELAGWEVKEQVHLGIFSFTKYLMWKDLQSRQDQLQQNQVVAHLINHPGQAFPSEPMGFEPSTLDATHQPQDLFAPLLSDSSQLRAICVAGAGRHLVIEGPPGTGKSQTITNLIAHLLASGKTVLFVSEKMAALEVVQRRLSSIGLGAFCLELHSSKAKKAEVLKQLGTALDIAGTRTVREWDMEAQRLADLRGQLNGLAQALHRGHRNDLTIFEAIGTCIEHAALPAAPMAWGDPDQHSRAELDTLREHSRQMAALAGQLGSLADHPLKAIARSSWTPNWQQDLIEAAARLERQVLALRDAAAAPLATLEIDGSALALIDLAGFDRLAELLLQAPALPGAVTRLAHETSTGPTLAKLRRHGQARNDAWASLGGAYVDDVASLAAAELRLEWAAASSTWWPKSWFAKRAVANRLRLYRSDGRRPQEAEIGALLPLLATLNTEDAALGVAAQSASKLLQDAFDGHRTDWTQVEAAEAWTAAYAQAVLELAGHDPAMTGALHEALQPHVADARAGLTAHAPLGRALAAYRAAYHAFGTGFEEVARLAGCPGLGLEPDAGAVLAQLAAMLRRWQEAARQLQPWCLWQGARARAIDLGMGGIVDALETGVVALADSGAYFEYSYRSWWLNRAIEREPVLCAFSSADHERKIAEFRQADSRFQQLTCQYIAARLAGQIPTSAGVAPSADSEMGKLRRELQKQRKHMPIRQLVQSLPTLMPRLKPCLLMSPLSVAQYLDAGHPQFDVVIFDEASQIPVWDAIGAIARGRQLVCVGDPKQLPPTSFFGRGDDDAGSADGALADAQDLESILDECLSIGLPELRLHWHYRSRHESLIAFSNVTYYDNALITFPSPVTEDRGVRLQQVAGRYDRGGSRTNRAEADAIVAAIEGHYLDPVQRAKSIGVVTFNQAQQSLIERLLDARRRALPALDAALSSTAPGSEALFIKNLENVQGDERDIIYFSITYGPDAAGKISLNFGPLNLEGGQRRLNVAISRARQGVVIFSTLLPEQIDLSRVRAAGVRDLKHYLEFAQRGARALAAQSTPTGLEPDSPFERQVIALLRRHGWTVHPQVGVSGYRIDIGVVDPRAPGRYLLGVECDGRTYHSGATARDRDRLRQHVLEGLGWELQRIWSTDWWLDPEQPARRLLARLDALLATPLAQQAAPALAVPPEAAQSQAMAEPVPAELPQYRASVLAAGDPECFYLPASRDTLRAQLREVIEAEGPVSRGVAFRRVSRAWGLARLGTRIESHLASLLPSGLVRSEDGAFLWPQGVDPATWDGLRVCGVEADSRRAADEVALEELANLAVFALRQNGSTGMAGLVRTLSRLIGAGRAHAELELRVGAALVHGRAAQSISVENGVVAAYPGGATG